MSSRPRKSLKLAVCTLLLAVLSPLVGAQNTTLDPLAEAPAIQQLIREEKAQGNAEAAWELEQGLLRVAAGYPNDVRSARILGDIGDRRLNILTQFKAGEFPPEIALGCYYSNFSQLTDGFRMGSQPITSTAVGDMSNSCTSGNYRRATQALSAEVHSLYLESARVLQRSEQAAGDELPEILMKLLANSYQTLNYQTGRWSLEALLSHQETNSAPRVARARTLALMGDWDLLFVRYLGTKHSRSATVSYEEAMTLLTENGVAEDDVNSIFSPQTPFLLPAFASNRLESEQTTGSTGHIDVSFEIRGDGRSARIKVLDSSVNASRSVQRELVNTIKNGRFRPIADNGQLLESAPVSVRYYLDD